MPEFNRRRFLQAAGGAAGAAALSGSILRAVGIPAAGRSGSIDDVEHIVVLMQENRSFDHYFGTLKGVRGFGDPRPMTLQSGKPVWHQSGGGKEVLPYRPDADDLGMKFLAGLDHDWETGHQAWNKGKFDNWIPAKTSGTMAYLTREDIPFHYALADAFTVCDAYHCSFMGATDPNRYYLYTGHVGNDGKGGGPVLGNEEAGYDWTTYAERLEKAGVSWKVYQDIGDGLDEKGLWGALEDAYRGNYADNSLMFFNAFRTAKPGDALYEKARKGTKVKEGGHLLDDLRADVKSGKLPQISWIAAPEAFCEHPNWPANYGAWYISQVLDALTSDPEVWSRTALFITYDENDGYFDHVPPPYPPADSSWGASTVDTRLDLFPGNDDYSAGPYGLGMRVPTLVVSPWSTGGYVCSEVFDHTSVIRFMERRFGVREPHISPWRRAVCGDLTSAFDFSLRHTRHAPLPSTAGYRPPDGERHGSYTHSPPADPALPRQERGARRTRPLPYVPLVTAAVRHSGTNVTLAFTAGEERGACFLVTSGNRTDGPWTYTAGPGETVSDTWSTASSDGTYDLTVHGPNGYLRSYRGSPAAAGPEVTGHHDKSSGRLKLTVANPGKADCHLTLTHAYGGRTVRLTVAAGERQTRWIDLGHSKRWYDLHVRSDDDRTYLRRLAGHVETGEPGTSDPALHTR
ncbi:phosphocholine-specific phospholipase C [Streptomyces sp. NPDC002446]